MSKGLINTVCDKTPLHSVTGQPHKLGLGRLRQPRPHSDQKGQVVIIRPPNCAGFCATRVSGPFTSTGFGVTYACQFESWSPMPSRRPLSDSQAVSSASWIA